ncbi:MAG: hypothetical protein RLZZ568_1401, partial [Cyanobacteriota bacterium]
QQVAAIAVVAHYDSGKPMAAAQVLVYAPENPQEPWLTGVTDEQGQFLFTPDGDRPGNWEIAVRQGGHGAMVTVPWNATMVNHTGHDHMITPNTSAPNQAQATPDVTLSSPLAAAPPPLSPLQRGITLGAIIWGFIGTAFFFSKRNGEGRA